MLSFNFRNHRINTYDALGERRNNTLNNYVCVPKYKNVNNRFDVECEKKGCMIPSTISPPEYNNDNNKGCCNTSHYRNPLAGYRKQLVTDCSCSLVDPSCVARQYIYKDNWAVNCATHPEVCYNPVIRTIQNRNGYINDKYNYSSAHYLQRRNRKFSQLVFNFLSNVPIEGTNCANFNTAQHNSISLMRDNSDCKVDCFPDCNCCQCENYQLTGNFSQTPNTNTLVGSTITAGGFSGIIEGYSYIPGTAFGYSLTIQTTNCPPKHIPSGQAIVSNDPNNNFTITAAKGLGNCETVACRGYSKCAVKNTNCCAVYKRSNAPFRRQGAVSGGSRINRLKYQTVLKSQSTYKVPNPSNTSDNNKKNAYGSINSSGNINAVNGAMPVMLYRSTGPTYKRNLGGFCGNTVKPPTLITYGRCRTRGKLCSFK